MCRCNNGSLGENNQGGGGGWAGGGASLWTKVSTDEGSDNTLRQRSGRLCNIFFFFFKWTLP